MVELCMEERAIACIQAVAVGDAMGKMTEGFWPEEISSTHDPSSALTIFVFKFNQRPNPMVLHISTD